MDLTTKSASGGASTDAKEGAATSAAAEPTGVQQNGETEAELLTGYVYVMSNQQTGNSVTVFDRGIDGELTKLATYVTGGLGLGNSYDLTAADDPLVSQGMLILSADERFLFAVDAGSDEITVLEIDGATLKVADRAPSGGTRPVSLTCFGNLLYVANAGGPPPNTPPAPDTSISGFAVSKHGKLTPIPDSTQPLLGGPGAAPSQAQFSPDGTKLIVTERQTSIIDVFPIDSSGRPGTPVKNTSNGPGPFTATFHGQDILLVTELVGIDFTYGSVSSYRLNADGTLTVITGSANTTELATCWTASSVLDPNVVYLANAQSGTVSGARFDFTGAITIFPPDGHLASARDSHATLEMDITRDGRFLYVLTGGYDEKLADPRLPTYVPGTNFSDRMSISVYRIEESDALTPLAGYAVADDPPMVISVGLLATRIGIAPGSEGIIAT